MDLDIVQQVMDELLPSLEALETQSAAIIQFVSDKGMANDQEFASYFERAGHASNVRWRATQVRIHSIISSAIKNEERAAEEEKEKTAAENSSAENQRENSEADPVPKGSTTNIKNSASEDSEAPASGEKQQDRDKSGGTQAA